MKLDPTAWVIVNRRGYMIVSTIASKRRGAIDNMVGTEAGIYRRWDFWKREGCRAVRVRLVRDGGE